MNTYLINAPHDQKIKTVENIDPRGIHAYSNPKYYESNEILAGDFGDICEGDQIIICRDSKLKYVAAIEEVIMATDQSGKEHDGLPVKILKGAVIKKFDKIKVSVSSFATRIIKAGIESPNLVNDQATGFKQRAFAEKLTREQVYADIRI